MKEDWGLRRRVMQTFLANATYNGPPNTRGHPGIPQTSLKSLWESVNKRNLGSKLAKKWNSLHTPTKGNVCFKMKKGGLGEKRTEG